MSDDVPMKRCKSCPEGEQWYPATFEFFHHNKGRKDGLCALCKVCACQKAKEHREADPEKYRTEQKARQRLPEARARKHAYDQARRSRPEIKEHRRIQDKAYYQQNRERILAQSKIYYNRPEVREREHARRETYY